MILLPFRAGSRGLCALVLLSLAGFAGCRLSPFDKLDNERAEAFDANDVAEIRRLFTNADEANCRVPTGSTWDYWARPLHLAVEMGDLETVQYLLGLGASPTAGDAEGKTPFHYLPHHLDQEETEEIIRALVAAGGDIDRPGNAYSMTPLTYAVMLRNTTGVAALVSQGADREAKDSLGRLPSDLIENEAIPSEYYQEEKAALRRALAGEQASATDPVP